MLEHKFLKFYYLSLSFTNDNYILGQVSKINKTLPKASIYMCNVFIFTKTFGNFITPHAYLKVENGCECGLFGGVKTTDLA